MKSLRVLKRVFRYVRLHIVYLVGSLVFAAIGTVAGLLIPIYVGKAIDLLIVSEVNFSALYTYLGVIGGLAAFSALMQPAQAIFNNRLAFLTVRDLRADVMKKLQNLPLAYFDAKPSGEIIGNMLGDAEAVSDGVLLGLTQLFTGFVTVLGTLVMMLLYNRIIALAVVVVTPLSLLLARFISKRTHEYFSKQAVLRAEMTGFVEESVANHKTVKAYSRENTYEKKYAALNEDFRKISLLATFFSSLPNPTTRLVNSMVYAAVALIGGLTCAGVWSVGGALTAGGLTGLLFYAGQFAKPFNEISGVITEVQASVVGVERIFSLLDQQNEAPDGEIALDARGEVAVEHAHFSYDPSKKLIRDLSLRVRAGEHVAVVGPTGCGKTTLINLLMRFYDVTDGAIKVDGLDVREVTRKSLRDGYGMVLQESWIRFGTVRENLTLGATVNEEEMIQAAVLCHADEFIRRLPDGYDTIIDDESLSQGEKQLLCITRVFLSAPKMLILDEATSAVDVRTEVKINEAFDLLMRDKTSFIVAHRLDTVKNADLILVMKDGDVVEQGTHAELSSRDTFYRKLYEAQSN